MDKPTTLSGQLGLMFGELTAELTDQALAIFVPIGRSCGLTTEQMRDDWLKAAAARFDKMLPVFDAEIEKAKKGLADA